MFKKERRYQIAKYISNKNKASVCELSETLNVSKETIRSDLTHLETKGLVKRFHGGAYCAAKSLQEISMDTNEAMEKLSNKNKTEQHSKNNNEQNKYLGKVFVFGSFNVDLVSYMSRLPKPGETLFSNKSIIQAGGKGSNQATAASMVTSNAFFACKVGSDHFSEYASNHLLSLNIEHEILKSQDQATGYAVIFVSEEDGENSISIHKGANDAITETEIAFLYEKINAHDLVLLQLENNLSAIESLVNTAKSLNKMVVLNPAPYREEVIKLLPQIDLVTPNESEAGLLTGVEINDQQDAKRALEKLAEQGVKQPLITLGSEGVVYKENDRFFHLAAYPAAVTDTTGAGDAFNGALSAAIASGHPISFAVKLASAFASLAVERQGASNMPTLQQALSRMESIVREPSEIQQIVETSNI